MTHYDSRMESALRLSVEVAEKAIRKSERKASAVEKGDEFVGHHAIVTKADIASQTAILHVLTGFSYGKFIAEEKEEGPYKSSVLTSDTYRNSLHGLVFGVDALDGTSTHNRGMYEWSISVGVMQDNEHLGGIIYAPDVLDGLTLEGTVRNGVNLKDRYGARRAAVAETRQPKDRSILFGVDVAIDDKLNDFRYEVSKQVRTTNVNGSNALAMALVAAGKADALVQTTQRVWDWFAGYPLIVGSGGKVQFYRRDNDSIVLVDKPAPTDYDPASKNLGFIAGNPTTVDELTQQLTEKWEWYGSGKAVNEEIINHAIDWIRPKNA